MPAWLELRLVPHWETRIFFHALEVSTDADGTRRIEVPDAGILVGRAAPARDGERVLQVREATLAKRHFEIVYDAGRWLIRDLKSTGGSFVNRDRVYAGRPRVLEDGDVIYLGAPSSSASVIFSSSSSFSSS